MPNKPGQTEAWHAKDPDPCLPWPERRVALIRWFATDRPYGMRWNGMRRGRSQHHKDILRAIADGLLRITPRVGRAKRLELTDAGRALIAPPAPPQAQPWAKRKAAVAELHASLRSASH